MKMISTRIDGFPARRAGVGILLLTSLLVSVAPALAGEYKLIKGQGVQVCEAYYKYLATQKTALTCARDIPSEYSQFKKPDWKRLDPNEHKLLILRIENYLQIPRDTKAIEPWVSVHRESEVASYQAPVHAQVFVADFDIDNDNTMETVLKYTSHSCQSWDGPKAPHWRAPLIVLDGSKQAIDVEKTYPLMQNPRKVYVANANEIDKFFQENKMLKNISKYRPKTLYEDSKYSPGYAGLKGYDTFIYNDKTYFDRWDEDKTGGKYQTLIVYKTEAGNTPEICRYQFRW